jgi:hypothetical protein
MLFPKVARAPVPGRIKYGDLAIQVVGVLNLRE